MDAGHLIAINVVLLYAILGPLVLVAFYVLFDSLAKPDEPEGNRPGSKENRSDPALWTDDDITAYSDRT
jgi:hypothetical protein